MMPLSGLPQQPELCREQFTHGAVFLSRAEVKDAARDSQVLGDCPTVGMPHLHPRFTSWTSPHILFVGVYML